MRFFVCAHCGNIITFEKSSGVPVMCCGEKMKELIPGTVDAAVEKHVPVIKTNGNKVSVEVGSVLHPMTEEHLIQWIILETKKGHQKVNLTKVDEPKADFLVTDGDEVVCAYEYCNLHGLWKSE